MNTSDLYAERTCPRCGNRYRKVASFCPHCGYVQRHTWLDDLPEWLGGSSGEAKPSSAQLVSAAIGGFVGLYLAYAALRKGSLIGLLVAAIPIVLAIRAWLLFRRTRQEPVIMHRPLEEEETMHELDENVPSEKFFCENCGSEVGEDALECPKCGMKFGG